jgi:hypothetical protein
MTGDTPSPEPYPAEKARGGAIISAGAMAMRGFTGGLIARSRRHAQPLPTGHYLQEEHPTAFTIISSNFLRRDGKASAFTPLARSVIERTRQMPERVTGGGADHASAVSGFTPNADARASMIAGVWNSLSTPKYAGFWPRNMPGFGP